MGRGAGVVPRVLWPGLVDGEGGHRGVGRRHPERLPALLPQQVGGDAHPGGEVDHGLVVVPESDETVRPEGGQREAQLTRTQTPGRPHCPLARRRSELSPSG